MTHGGILLWVVLCLTSRVLGIDCSESALKKYNFESIKGIHSVSVEKDTPPTETRRTWYVGICESINDVEHCPKNSDVCGITEIIKDKNTKNPLISEIVGFNSNLHKSYEDLSDSAAENGEGVKVVYKDANWGDNLVGATISFLCSTKEDDESYNKLKIVKWENNNLQLSMKTKAACVTSENDKKKNKDGNKDKSNKDQGESWGWFTWIFIFLVLFLSIYIIGGAWFQYSKGNAIDFQSALKEVLENFIDLLRGLPAFIKEIIEKFTGNSNRGEYSAV